ncbi:hypothetical protein ESA94_02545 [Lacibacter luteus]|uniref:VCBS repeat-containing protein n=1 Tax=Lacibacter luteus TaxID=2508719 RepID=A0A4Q1CLP9_9BACT|nr:hypothetical protein [Lacibacter luteus]RXK61910.1 hypothetical protein ESA94_02545 [Lacibacter luteus]
MKKTICLIVLFVANHVMAQLKVEELMNDSLVKAFVCEQTGRNFQNVHLVSIDELKERKQLEAVTVFDSLQTVHKLVDDFNEDGKKDLIVSYAFRVPSQMYFDGFFIQAFVSNEKGKYDLKDLWHRYEYLLGRIIGMDRKSKSFVVARQWIDFRKEVLGFDTLFYFQGEFINKNNTCNIGFDQLEYYTTSNWLASSYKYSYFTLFANGVIRREDFDMGNRKIYQCQLKKEIFDSLNNLICAVNLWELKGRYEMENVHDVGTSHLVISYKGTVKKIDDYGHWGNFGLAVIYKTLSRLSKDSDWVLIEQITKKDEGKY